MVHSLAGCLDTWVGGRLWPRKCGPDILEYVAQVVFTWNTTVTGINLDVQRVFRP